MPSTLQSTWDLLSEQDNPCSHEAYGTRQGGGVRKQVNKQMNEEIQIVRSAIKIIAWWDD